LVLWTDELVNNDATGPWSVKIVHNIFETLCEFYFETTSEYRDYQKAYIYQMIIDAVLQVAR